MNVTVFLDVAVPFKSLILSWKHRVAVWEKGQQSLDETSADVRFVAGKEVRKGLAGNISGSGDAGVDSRGLRQSVRPFERLDAS